MQDVVGQCAKHHDRDAVKRCARCGDNLCTDCVSISRGDVCAPCQERLELRGKVPHVEWLAIVTMVHGTLMLTVAVFILVYLGVFGAALAGQEVAPSAATIPTEMFGIVGGFGLLMASALALPGALQIVAGWYMRTFRYRWLSLLSLFGGLLLSVVSCVGVYCIPTALALTIWGAIVLFDASVAKRFAEESAK